jgi:valyl-tRNA synthetase
LGNSPDLLGLIDQYGADAARFGIMIASPAGNDILFDETALEQGRNFNNKIWNAMKLVKMWEVRQSDSIQSHPFAVDWFEHRLREVRLSVDDMMRQFKLSEALKTIYSLIWDDFCSWYLEWIKPDFEQPISKQIYQKTIRYFSELMQLLHPFMPFVTEEVFHQLTTRDTDLCILRQSACDAPNQSLLDQGRLLQQVISGIRDVRNKQQIKPKESIRLHIMSNNTDTYNQILPILAKQVKAESIAFTTSAIEPSFTTVIGKDTFYLASEQPINTEQQKVDLEKELNHLIGFLASVEKKLSNEKFMQNARPDVLALEQKKKADATAKIQIIRESLEKL